MSGENGETIKRGAEAWNRDDFDAWIGGYDPGVEWSALMEVYRGHAGARHAWESFKGDMQLTVRFDDVRDLGESVLALGEIESTGQTTGLSFTNEIAQPLTFRDGCWNRPVGAEMPGERLHGRGGHQVATGRPRGEAVRPKVRPALAAYQLPDGPPSRAALRPVDAHRAMARYDSGARF